MLSQKHCFQHPQTVLVQAVYEGDLVHRLPGDPSTMSPVERTFSKCVDWVARELQHPPQSQDPSSQLVAESPQASQAQAPGSSFTRVVVADLKPEVLQQISDADRYATVCRDLAHLYHYYLHGEHGNRLHTAANQEAAAQQGGSRPNSASSDAGQGKAARPTVLPSGQKLPDIVIEHAVEGQPEWYAHLVDVDDDPESLYLRSQQAELQFSLTVPDHGVVSGVLWYFPYQDDTETMPLEQHPMLYTTAQNAIPTQLTQAGPSQHTQLPAGTQAPFGNVRLYTILNHI